MRVVYQKLFDKLKANGIKQTDFREDTGISGSSMNKLRNNENVTVDTICKICDFFCCMPDEIMEWIPDAEWNAKEIEKQAIEAQIAELQAKLKNM